MSRTVSASAKSFKPSRPATFAISWASATTVVVPQRIAASENLKGVVIELSMCMCTSINPGIMNLSCISTQLSASSSVIWPE
ncbi:hypothetical protein DSECCO2_548670 [anaerobic digester metagenome]